MAEVIAAIGVAASVAQLADYGFKLSVKLYSFSQAVSTADSSIKGISNDVSLTSTVLQELCHILKDEKAHVVSVSAVEATERTVKECLLIFEQLSSALDKSLGAMGEGKRKGRVALEKLKWPFKQPKMELLRGNLDRLKASLTLMLQVLSYARSISNRKEMETSFEYQKHLVKSLARSERVTRRRYLALRTAIEDKGDDDTFNVTTNTSKEITEEDFSTNVLGNSLISEEDTLIGELLLSFKLLDDTLTPQVQRNFTSEAQYEFLRSVLDDFQTKEGRHWEAIHEQSSPSVKTETARKVQVRLKQFLRAGYLEYTPRGGTPPPYDPEIPEIHEIATTCRVNVSHPETAHSGSVLHSAESPERFELEQYDPYLTDPSTKSAQVQAQIDSTVGIMRENINKVSQRGERLNSLIDKTDDLAVSAQGFRRGANRVRKNMWWEPIAGVTQAVVEFGSESWMEIQGLSDTILQAGSSLFAERVDERAGGDAGRPWEDCSDEEEEEELPENYVDDLLSEWTTLPREKEE